MLVHIIVIVLFIALGILLSLGKGTFLIAGYNTMPKKEKAKFDTFALGKFMGKILFLLAGCVGFWLADEIFPGLHLFCIGQILFIAVLFFALFYMNTKGRFKSQ